MILRKKLTTEDLLALPYALAVDILRAAGYTRKAAERRLSYGHPRR